MKRTSIIKAAIALSLAATITLSTAAMVSAAGTPAVARTKAWDGIIHTLGGVPESVRKVEYAGSIFYLAPNITDGDFLAVLAAGPEAVRLKPPQENGSLYSYPVYILWNAGKTVLLVHPIIFGYDDILDAVSVPTALPATLTAARTPDGTPMEALSEDEAIAYMLSDEYADAVRAEFYRLVNEHRRSNGLRGLETNLELQGYADMRSEELRVRFGHTRPDGSPAGGGWHNSRNNLNTRYAENALTVGAIGADPLDAAMGIFNRWKNSEGHNRHMLYEFPPGIKMALGISPKLDADVFVTTGAIFATGY